MPCGWKESDESWRKNKKSSSVTKKEGVYILFSNLKEFFKWLLLSIQLEI